MYKCSNCGYESKSFFGLCSRCKVGIGEEVEASSSSSSRSSGNQNTEKYSIGKVSKEYKRDKVILKTKYEGLNKVLSSNGGFVEQQIIALGAQPGIGKSTLCTEISDDDTIYISTEESFEQVNSRFLRVNPSTDASIVSVTSLEAILEIIETTDASMVIIDSLNSINNGTDGYLRQSQNVYKLSSALKKHNKCAVIICQVAKSGEITGMNTVLHTVDTVMYLERSLVSSHLILSSNKNRFGEIGSVAIFDHTETGLREVTELEDKDDKQIGVTFTKAKFGYRSLDICIEALVVPSSLNLGLRKVNGINPSRIHQIIGILSYNSNINFTNKDVYVAVSNGLTINDTKIDLAICNSILSSYFGKESKLRDVSGELSLNGKIRGSDKHSHIKDIIDLYKH